MTEVAVEGRRVRVTNLEKVLWPGTGFRKGEMLAYYLEVAPALLPHLAGRPVTLARFPDGVEGPGWYQARCRGRPDWVRVARVPSRITGEPIEYCLIDDAPTLLWAANLGTVEFHPFLARVDELERPTSLVFDLDPGAPAGILEAAALALRVRDFLTELGLRAFAKTSGGKGVHLVAPLAPEHAYDETKAFARAVAAALARDEPQRVTDRMIKAERPGKVFVDWGQNDPGKSTVAPYSLRARATPSVAAPLSWEEVESAVAAGDEAVLRVGPEVARERLAGAADPWTGFDALAQRLPAVR